MLKWGVRTKFRKIKNSLRRKWYSMQAPFPFRADYPLNIVLCGVCHNEASILQEWIPYHLSLGFDRIVLYDNNSTDNSRALLKPYEEAGVLEWRKLEAEPFSMWDQIKAYNRLIKEMRYKAKWIWFLDTDEFLVPCPGRSVSGVLQDLEKDPHTGGVLVNWLFFGTSGLSRIPEGKHLIESLVMRAPDDHKGHAHTKCALRPEASPGFFEHPHYPYTFNKRKLVYPDKQEFRPESNYIDHSLLKIHHYWHRDEAFYREVKLPRRDLLVGKQKRMTSRAEEKFLKIANSEKDESILPFIAGMEKSIAKYMQRDSRQ